ncbi:MAG: ATP-binding protein [Candidatus Nanoarchaeia archaeon]|nr:ATP-binding protein [Candidatus Nanoarchaeia archaeon]
MDTSLKDRLELDIKNGESSTVEFMQNYPSKPHDLAKEIAAFATTGPGTIYLGVDKKCNIVGISLDGYKSRKDTKDEIQNRLANLCRENVDPPMDISVWFIEYDNKQVVKIFIPKGRYPVYYSNHVPYLRMLTTSRPASAQQVEELFESYFNSMKIFVEGNSRERVFQAGNKKNSENPWYDYSRRTSFFLSVLLPLADFELMWSDINDRQVDSELEQLKYDIKKAGEDLLRLSWDHKATHFRIKSWLGFIAGSLIKLSEPEFYLDGGKSWLQFQRKGNELLEEVHIRILEVRGGIRIPYQDFFGPLEKFHQLVKETEDLWKKRNRYLNRNEIPFFKDMLRRIAYEFYHFYNVPQFFYFLYPEPDLRRVIFDLRTLSSSKYFGCNKKMQSFDELENKMEKVLEDLREVDGCLEPPYPHFLKRSRKPLNSP